MLRLSQARLRPGGRGCVAFRAQPLDTEGTFQKASSGGKGAGVCLCEYVGGVCVW